MRLLLLLEGYCWVLLRECRYAFISTPRQAGRSCCSFCAWREYDGLQFIHQLTLYLHSHAHRFRNRLITPLFFAHFLRLRFHMSSQTRQAFGYVNAQLDSLIAHPSCPQPVKKGLDLGRDLIVRYGGSILQTGPAPAAAGAQPAQAR
jgi:hypothetical protein